jgi:hypothetical protein
MAPLSTDQPSRIPNSIFCLPLNYKEEKEMALFKRVNVVSYPVMDWERSKELYILKRLVGEPVM